MAAITRKFIKSASLLTNCHKGRTCQPLLFARNMAFTYVPDTPLQEYGIVSDL